MTGDDQMRRDFRMTLIAHYPGNSATEEFLDDCLALIRQDRRELLEFLKNHAVAENDEVYFIKVKKSSLDAELQHLTGLDEGEADHE